jgi:glutathione synthase/RimK-type ligase-like ATP-grasp enzyme
MIDALLITSLSERYYYDAFVKECENLGLRVGILDPEYFVETNASLHVRMDASVPVGFLNVVRLGADKNETFQVSLDCIKVAWHLRVNRARKVRDISDASLRFKWNESLYALEALCSVLTCQWINTFASIDRVSCNKLLQQQLASKAGLRTPQTMVSNVEDPILAFSREKGGTLLLKSIGYVSLDPDNRLVLYSELFETRELERSAASIRACPLYAQEYVQKKCEYRVMVIGNEVLACKIDSQASEKTRIDWRHYDFENVSHTAITLPEDLQGRLLKFMELAGLSYGALDLIETPTGEWVFLEVNPSGQWEWLEKLAQLPIPQAVARMLKSHCA